VDMAAAGAAAIHQRRGPASQLQVAGRGGQVGRSAGAVGGGSGGHQQTAETFGEGGGGPAVGGQFGPELAQAGADVGDRFELEAHQFALGPGRPVELAQQLGRRGHDLAAVWVQQQELLLHP
jgi:hypothetical protein